MSLKTIVCKASCKSNTVTVDGVELPGAEILSAGQAQSQGIAILCGGDAFYVAIPKETLAQLISLMRTLVQTVQTGILPSNGGGAIVDGTFATQLAALKQQLDTLGEQIQ